MKKILLLMVLMAGMFTANGQNTVVKPIVDERTELLGVVFRLGGAKEYINNHIAVYAADIDAYFAPQKEHEIIKWIPELRDKYGIGYDAVASYAIHIQIKKGKITFIDNVAENDLESRWKPDVAAEFLKKLNDFYKKSNFNKFFADHKPMYTIAEERFATVLEKVDMSWFEKFFGEKPQGEFNLIISLTNGGGNYGTKVIYKDGKQSLYAIMGSWMVDKEGQPTYDPGVSLTVVHEYNHSFCNPLIDEYHSQLETKAIEFYTPYEQILKRQAYGSAKTYLYEILVRACELEYYKNTGAKQENINRQTIQEQQRGFIWIDKLGDALEQYASQRDKYPTLRSFMPEIVKLQNGLSVEQSAADYAKKTIRIVSVSIANGATDVMPGLQPLTVVFDKPMYTGNNGTSYGKRGKEFFPEFSTDKKAHWNMENKKEWTIYIILKPDTEYSLSFPARMFIGENGEPVLGTYYLDFKTSK